LMSKEWAIAVDSGQFESFYDKLTTKNIQRWNDNKLHGGILRHSNDTKTAGDEVLAETLKDENSIISLPVEHLLNGLRISRKDDSRDSSSVEDMTSYIPNIVDCRAEDLNIVPRTSPPEGNLDLKHHTGVRCSRSRDRRTLLAYGYNGNGKNGVRSLSQKRARDECYRKTGFSKNYMSYLHKSGCNSQVNCRDSSSYHNHHQLAPYWKGLLKSHAGSKFKYPTYDGSIPSSYKLTYGQSQQVRKPKGRPEANKIQYVSIGLSNLKDGTKRNIHFNQVNEIVKNIRTKIAGKCRLVDSDPSSDISDYWDKPKFAWGFMVIRTYHSTLARAIYDFIPKITISPSSEKGIQPTSGFYAIKGLPQLGTTLRIKVIGLEKNSDVTQVKNLHINRDLNNKGPNGFPGGAQVVQYSFDEINMIGLYSVEEQELQKFKNSIRMKCSRHRSDHLWLHTGQYARYIIWIGRGDENLFV
jgi:hypothetical protein